MNYEYNENGMVPVALPLMETEDYNKVLQEMLVLFEDFNKFKAETGEWDNAEEMVINRMLLVES